jgi:hypothetical protein
VFVPLLAARDASQNGSVTPAAQNNNKDIALWRERAIIAEALAKNLQAAVKDRDAKVRGLIGQLYDPEGRHRGEENAKLRELVISVDKCLHEAMIENNQLRRSLKQHAPTSSVSGNEM